MPASTVAVPPHSIMPLGLAGYSLLLCSCDRPHRLSHLVHLILILNLPRTITQSTPCRAMMLAIESGVLYLLVQLIYVVLFALDSPTQATAGTMSIQIYLRSSSLALSLLAVILSTCTGHRTKHHCRWCWAWHVFGACPLRNRLYGGRSSRLSI